MGSPMPSIRWLKNGREFRGEHRIGGIKVRRVADGEPLNVELNDSRVHFRDLAVVRVILQDIKFSHMMFVEFALEMSVIFSL